jgi:hypothetical protein
MHLTGIKIQGVNLTETSDAKKITLTFSGNFSDIGQYVEYLENLPVPLVIETISIAHDGVTLSNLITKLQGGFHVSTQE